MSAITSSGIMDTADVAETSEVDGWEVVDMFIDMTESE